ncbi:MAG: phospholipase D family protein [Gammaproteobacteria bacterium]|nr:phospholipase D family protein [Gammaproteobacteria bacterium]
MVVALHDNQDESVSLPVNTDFCKSIDLAPSNNLSQFLKPYEDKMSSETAVLPLETGKSAILTRAWLSDAAEKTIDVQYFIFSRDNTGLIAFNYLVRAAQRGVKVRVLVDDFMLEFEEEEILALASHPNIQIKIFNPGVSLGKNIVEKITTFVTDFKGANHRMHNKLFIVDGKALITGGRNVEGMYFDFDHHYNFRDRDILLIGNTVNAGQGYFNDYWNNRLSVDVHEVLNDVSLPDDYRNTLNKLNEYACNPNNYWPQIREAVVNLPDVFAEIEKSGELVWTKKAELVCDAPEKKTLTSTGTELSLTTERLIKLISESNQNIEIQTPYLVTTEPTRNLFKQKVSEGVRIRVLTNSLASTDNVEAFSGYQRDREELLATGIEVYEFKPDAKVRLDISSSELQNNLGHTAIFGMHAKTMIIDGKITVIGTFNLDPRSANLNTECLAIINNESITESVLEGVEEEFKPENSWRVTKEFNPDNEVDLSKRLKTRTRYIIPKDVL